LHLAAGPERSRPPNADARERLGMGVHRVQRTRWAACGVLGIVNPYFGVFMPIASTERALGVTDPSAAGCIPSALASSQPGAELVVVLLVVLCVLVALIGKVWGGRVEQRINAAFERLSKLSLTLMKVAATVVLLGLIAAVLVQLVLIVLG
jgi:hypothetical protein